MDSEINGKSLGSQQDKKVTQDAMPIVTSEEYENWKKRKGKVKENQPDKVEKSPSSKSSNLLLVIAVIGCSVIIVAILVLNLSTTVDGQRTSYFQVLKGKIYAQVDNSEKKKYDLPTLIKEKGPSVVSIYGVTADKQMVMLGSGYFVYEDGAVITNYHVLKNATQAIIRTKGDRDYNVTGILAVDELNDLMMLAVDIPKPYVKPLRHTADVEEGEDIVVIGNPKGLENTVSNGIISAHRLDKIQISAPISPGSSGGPVLNMKGEVVCVVVSSVRNAQNLNFCIPASYAKQLKPGNLVSLQENAEKNKNDRDYAEQGRTPNPQRPATPQLGRDNSQVYCCLDQNGAARFTTDSMDLYKMPGGACTQVSQPGGAIEISKFESWVFNQLGGNPYIKDPIGEARQEVDIHIPRLFDQFFGGRIRWENNMRLSQAEADAFLKHVDGIERNVAAQKSSEKQININKHKYIMNNLKTFCGASGRCTY